MVQTFTNKANPFDLGLDPKFGFIKAYYDINIGVGLENGLDQDYLEGLMNTWVMASTWSHADMYININFLNMYILNLRFNTIPFHIIPLYFSLIYIHPAAIAHGVVDEFALALNCGYLFNLGEFHLYYYVN